MVPSADALAPVSPDEPGMAGRASRDHAEPFCSTSSGRSVSTCVPHLLHVYPGPSTCPLRPTLTLASCPATGLYAPASTGTGPGERDTRTATTTPAKVRAASARAVTDRRTIRRLVRARPSRLTLGRMRSDPPGALFPAGARPGPPDAGGGEAAAGLPFAPAAG